MTDEVEVRLFFNFRSPYCYLASKTMFEVLNRFPLRLLWRPLGGADGRSAPDRAKVKMPISRQDAGRWAKRMGIPFQPPPVTTNSVPAGCASLLAEREGLLQPYVEQVMHSEWGEGRDIGDLQVLLDAGEAAGLARDAVEAAAGDPAHLEQLAANWAEAGELGIFGVPTFVVHDQIFWGNDRIDFLREYLEELA